MTRTLLMIVAVMLLLMSSCSVESQNEPKWQTLEHANGAITVDYPGGWLIERKDHFVLMQPPGGEEAVILSTFMKRGSTLEEFSSTRFFVEQDIYRPVNEARVLEAEEWSGVTLLSQGVYPGENEETTRYMFCVCETPICASVTVYTSPERFSRQKFLYDQVFGSLKFNAGK